VLVTDVVRQDRLGFDLARRQDEASAHAVANLERLARALRLAVR
jgi:hypothetical protein